MSIIMNMGSHEIEGHNSMNAGYGDEVLCSGWNPALDLARQECALPKADEHMTIPPNLATVDADTFLQKMYACQR